MNFTKLQLLAITWLACFSLAAQPRYLTKQGQITFFSEAPLENIEAKNSQVSSIIDFSTQEVAVTMEIKSFKFDKSLMEEHFNENYLESHKYPKATFKGKYSGDETIDLSKPGKYPVNVEGELTLHGVTKKLTTTGFIEVAANVITATTKFQIAIRDYDIEVPKLVIKNIAEVVDVTVTLPYSLDSKLK